MLNLSILIFFVVSKVVGGWSGAMDTLEQMKTEDGGNLSTTLKDSTGQNRNDPGGKSANLNFEGAIDLSVGQDLHDRKSIVLDTAGSLVAWFGADRNNRSVIMQTDGDMLLNIGGHNGNSFNPGRFDLRVNVTDKGFVGDSEHVTDDGSNQSSDYLISISKNGLVIAGMQTGNPMVIRNNGNLMLESSTKLILQGQSVEVREGGKMPRPTHQAPVAADTPGATAEGILNIIECLFPSDDE